MWQENKHRGPSSYNIAINKTKVILMILYVYMCMYRTTWIQILHLWKCVDMFYTGMLWDCSFLSPLYNLHSYTHTRAARTHTHTHTHTHTRWWFMGLSIDVMVFLQYKLYFYRRTPKHYRKLYTFLYIYIKNEYVFKPFELWGHKPPSYCTSVISMSLYECVSPYEPPKPVHTLYCAKDLDH